ncbi:MAG: hypothetical protein KIT84_10735 [Labilithrix sp.]|nr:hypothetical protein [Labilithrix sp.]MCW5811482.1 hypothetical protein [Labilithrix sp.]
MQHARMEEPEEAVPTVTTAIALLLEGDRARIRVGRAEHVASLDPSVHPSVVATAIARAERLVVERADGAWTILGALRTSPTPGIEEADEYVIRAARVKIRAKDEFTVASGAAAFAVRAYGTIESFAEQITSRASAVHKIVGRMLHLN